MQASNLSLPFFLTHMGTMIGKLNGCDDVRERRTAEWGEMASHTTPTGQPRSRVKVRGLWCASRARETPRYTAGSETTKDIRKPRVRRVENGTVMRQGKWEVMASATQKRGQRVQHSGNNQQR